MVNSTDADRAAAQRRNHAAKARATADPVAVIETAAGDVVFLAGLDYLAGSRFENQENVSDKDKADRENARLVYVFLASWATTDFISDTERLDRARLVCDLLMGLPTPSNKLVCMLAWAVERMDAKPYHPKNRGNLPALHRVVKTEAETLMPGTGIAGNSAEQDGTMLPMVELQPAIKHCPSWILNLYNQAGYREKDRTKRQGGNGAPWALRLLTGAMLHLPLELRDGNWQRLHFPLEEVEGWLHRRDPETKSVIWRNRARDFHLLPEALKKINRSLGWVDIGKMYVACVFVSAIPKTPDAPGVEFTIRIPGSAARGARIEWPALREYGRISPTLFSAYLSACAFMHNSARKGHPITAEIGRPILDKDGRSIRKREGGTVVRSKTALTENPAAKFVPKLTDYDLTRLIGLEEDNRKHRLRARRAFEQLHQDGRIDLRNETERGRNRWKIFGVHSSQGNQTASCGNKAASCGNKAASCGNKAASCGNKAASCGNET